MNKSYLEYLSDGHAAVDSLPAQAPITSSLRRPKSRKRKKGSHPASPAPGKNSEIISPFSAVGLPLNFDFIANMTSGEKIDHIKSILLRSEDEAVAEIAPALRLHGTAAQVMEAYLPLVVEVKKHFCRTGRPGINPATGEPNRTWREICEKEFGITIRRMQQILASLKESKPAGGPSVKNPKPQINRGEFKRACKIAAPAVVLACEIVKNRLADKFPQAMEVLKEAGVPVPEVEPPAVPDCTGKDDESEQDLRALLATLERSGEKLPLAVLRHMRDIMKKRRIRHEQLSTPAPAAPASNLYHVKQLSHGQDGEFAVIRAGHKAPVRIFETENEAQDHCDHMNSSPVSSLSMGSQTARRGQPHTALRNGGGVK